MTDSGRHNQIDLTYLNNMSDGDEGFIKTMLETFLTTVPDIIIGIQEHLREKEWEALAQEIHKLKPTLKYLGVNSLDEIMPLTESNCKTAQNFEQIGEGVEYITKVTESVLEETRTLISARA